MATQGSTYGQAYPMGTVKHRRHVEEMAGAAKTRRNTGQSAGRAKNRANVLKVLAGDRARVTESK